MPVTAEIAQLQRQEVPFVPDQQLTVGGNRYTNTGDTAGTVNAEVVEVLDDGTIQQSLCTTQINMAPGEMALTVYNEIPEDMAGVSVCQSVMTTADGIGPLIVVLPQETELKMGFRVWGADESPPSFGPPPDETPQAATWSAVTTAPAGLPDLSQIFENLPPEARVGAGVAGGGVAGGVLAALFGGLA